MQPKVTNYRSSVPKANAQCTQISCWNGDKMNALCKSCCREYGSRMHYIHCCPAALYQRPQLWKPHIFWQQMNDNKILNETICYGTSWRLRGGLKNMKIHKQGCLKPERQTLGKSLHFHAKWTAILVRRNYVEFVILDGIAGLCQSARFSSIYTVASMQVF